VSLADADAVTVEGEPTTAVRGAQASAGASTAIAASENEKRFIIAPGNGSVGERRSLERVVRGGNRDARAAARRLRII
jgi:hypothetical protein